VSGHRTIGLSGRQFRELMRRLESAVRWGAPGGRPRALTLETAARAALLYLRQNVTQEMIASVFGVGQATISRILAQLVPAIEAVLEDFVPDLATAAAGRATVVDGTVTPCWNWANARDRFSGKHRRPGHNHQVVVDLSGNLLHISDPQPGSVHDIEALRRSSIPHALDLQGALADKGYIGSTMITPKRKPAGKDLHEADKAYNRQVNRLRAVVERTIAHVKTWKVLHTPYRQPLCTYPITFGAVRALCHYAQTEPF
jgi:urease accessory protein UreF